MFSLNLLRMKYLLLFLFALPVAAFINVDPPATGNAADLSPLSKFSAEWNQPKYKVCNTAANANYMTEEEKKLIYIINLMRMNPVLFANTVTKKYPDSSGMGYLKNLDNYVSLLSTLRKLKPLNLLYPDSLCFEGASCHAVASGIKGYVGHVRADADCKSKWYFNGECCDYGHSKALDILMNLMIDEGVPSLGHRNICLSKYGRIGVAIRPHIGYGHNAVLDFHY